MSESHLSVIRGARGEQGLKRVVAGDQEAGKIDEELASDVEEDQEEVNSSQTQDGIHLGDGGLSLEVVEGGVLGELPHRLMLVHHSPTKRN